MSRGRAWDGTEYLCKHQLLPPQIAASPEANLALIVTIPAHDEPDLVDTLDSLARCTRPAAALEIIVGINLPEGSHAQAADMKLFHGIHNIGRHEGTTPVNGETLTDLLVQGHLGHEVIDERLTFLGIFV